MDAFADRMTARGPTLSADRTAWTGSLHVVDLDDQAAAHAFAVNEPYHRAGLFQEHMIRLFDNLLGRTMWDATTEAGEVPFLILAHGNEAFPTIATPQVHPSPAIAERLVLWGALRPADEIPDLPGRSGSVALVLLAPHEAAARTMIAANPNLLGECTSWDIHAWEFGGRR